jgi:hypothetical protein
VNVVAEDVGFQILVSSVIVGEEKAFCVPMIIAGIGGLHSLWAYLVQGCD